MMTVDQAVEMTADEEKVRRSIKSQTTTKLFYVFTSLVAHSFVKCYDGGRRQKIE